MNIVVLALVGDMYYITPLCRALSKGNSITAMCPKSLARDGVDHDVRLIELPERPRAIGSTLDGLNPFWLKSLLAAIRKAKPDVVHIAYETRIPFFHYSFLRNLCPTVLTIHEAEPFFDASPIRTFAINPMIRLNNRLAAKLSDRIIVHGTRHKEFLVAQGVPKEKVSVIPLGALSFFEAWARTDLEPSEPNVLYLGRIWPYKGIQYLLQAAIIVQEQEPNVTFTIAGQGDFSRYAELASRVRSLTVLNTYVPEPEVAELFQKATLVVLPYVHGSQTFAISIAHTFRKPVIATDTGNLPEMVQHGRTGLIVPPRDARSLAKAILKLLADPLRSREMGERGYNSMRREMSWEITAEKTLQVYAEAAAMRGNPGIRSTPEL